jgi:Tfp pilus assembly protein PilF
VRWHTALALVALAGITIVAFHEILTHDFTQFDDPDLLYQNPVMYQPLATGLLWNWTHVRQRLYTPVPYDAWVLIAAVAKERRSDGSTTLNPAYFHAASILVHFVTAGLVFLLLRELLNNVWAAIIGAAFFAVHPLAVEPVAWASGLYTLMSAAFSIWALYHYVRFLKTPPDRKRAILGHQVLGTIAFALAVLSKPTAASMLLAAIAIHLFLQQPLKRMAVLAIWFAIAVATYFVASHFQQASFVQTPWVQRPFIAADAVVFYGQKILSPVNLIPDYGRWPAKVVALPSVSYSWAIAVALAIVFALAVRRAPRLALGFALCLSALLPYLGLVSFDFQWFSTVADRYAYLALLGVAFLVATIVCRWKWTIGAFVGVIVLWTVMTSAQAARWQNTGTLFRYTLSVRPQSLMANKVLGNSLIVHDPTAAEVHLKAALAEKADDPQAHGDLALILIARGDFSAAEEHLRQAIRVMPEDPRYHHDLAAVFSKTGRMDQAADGFREAIRLAAAQGKLKGELHQNLGFALAALGRMEEAQAQWRRALQLTPGLEKAKQALERTAQQRP